MNTDLWYIQCHRRCECYRRLIRLSLGMSSKEYRYSAVVLKVGTLEQWHQHHLGICQKFKFLSPTLNYWVRTCGHGAQPSELQQALQVILGTRSILDAGLVTMLQSCGWWYSAKFSPGVAVVRRKPPHQGLSPSQEPASSDSSVEEVMKAWPSCFKARRLWRDILAPASLWDLLRPLLYNPGVQFLFSEASLYNHHLNPWCWCAIQDGTPT